MVISHQLYIGSPNHYDCGFDKHVLKLITYRCQKLQWFKLIQCLKAYKYDMSKIIIPKDHQKYLQREFTMGSGAGSGIY